MLPEFFRDLGFPAESLLESRWAEVEGRLIHSRSCITAKANSHPFVLIHGLVISSLYMIPVAELLAERHAVHAIDLPGFGRSEGPSEILSVPRLAQSVISWMNEVGMPRCHLVGNSLGCEIAAHVAVQAPGKVASLTLIGPTLDPRAFAVGTQTFRLLRDATREPVRLWMNWIFDFLRAGVRRAIGTTREMFRDHIQLQLPLVAAPTLIIRGSTDPTVPQLAAEEMVHLLQKGKLRVLEGQPHCVHYTEPRAVYSEIERHIASLTVPGK